MPGAPVEREVKLDVDDDFAVPDLSGLEGLGTAVIVEELASLELIATYHDTVDLRLLRAGVTLRHRRGGTEGDGTWTLKLPAGDGSRGGGAGGGATFDRHELDWPGPPDVMAPAALDLVLGLRRRRPLTEVAVVHTVRARAAVRSADGSSAVEVDDDRVTATTSAASSRFRQVEVEVTGGDPILVEVVADRLRQAGARLGPAEPKVQRILADRLAELRPGSPAALRADSTMGEVTAAALSAALDRLVAHDPGVRLGCDPEAVHQARVAIRRLRADLSTLRGLLDDTWVARVRAELRALAAAFGQVRDADVLLGRLEGYRPTLRPSDIGGFDRLVGRLSDERVGAGRHLAAVMGADAYLDLLDELSDATSSLPRRGRNGPGRGRTRLAAPAVDVLPRLLDTPWRRLRAAVEGLDDPPGDDELHDIRKRAKRLRYNAELAAPVLGVDCTRLAKAAARLQSVLGDHHDAVVVEEWLQNAGRVDTETAGVVGALVEVQREVQRDRRGAWPEAWATLNRKQLRRAVG